MQKYAEKCKKYGKKCEKITFLLFFLQNKNIGYTEPKFWKGKEKNVKSY